MENSKRLWRVLFFLVMIAALCGSFAFPVVNMPVKAAPASAPAPGEVVISEFRTSGSNPGSQANDEFIELYNVTGGRIDISGLEIWGSNGNASPATSRRLTIAANTVLEPGQHYLVANSGGYSITSVPANQTYGVGLTDDGGIALILPNASGGTIIDQVGMSTNSAYKEGSVLSPLAGNLNQSYERKPGGALGSCTDTNNNLTDFGSSPISPSDPQNMASPLVYCAGLQTFTPTSTSTNTDTPTATSTGTVTHTPTATGTPTITPTSTGTLSVIINEVAWSGTAANTDDEWIELYNTTGSTVDLAGWHLYGDDNTVNKVGSPNIALSGTIPAGGYYLLERNEQAVSDVTANQVYSTGDLLNTGERLYLKDKSGNTIDIANSDGGAWPAGTASSTYASMERVGTTSQWLTYAGTVPIAHDRNGNAIKGTPGSGNWSNSVTITTITSDLPDPSLVNQNVTVVVSVIGGKTIPSGTVNITGANTNCSLTLAANGTGSCVIRYTSVGTKTITATYLGDSTHPASSDTETHQVSTSTSTFHTSTPAPAPPPPLVAINEFVPRPGHDWNLDGVVNVGDEYIEVLNHGTINVNLSGYTLDDEVNIGSSPFTLPALTLRPGERYVFYGSETGLLLGDGGDAVRLTKPNGQLADAYNYSVAGYPDQSFCRLPDNGGADDWNTDCFPTPGLQNSLSGEMPVPVNNASQELYCPIADTLPIGFTQAECQPFGNNIYRPEYWDQTGWYGNKPLPWLDGKWPILAN